MNVSNQTIIRTVLLFISLINVILNLFGHKTLPIEDETWENLVSTILLIVTALNAWWCNNSFTEEAIMADEYLEDLREN